jgi:hypothetical protein
MKPEALSHGRRGDYSEDRELHNLHRFYLALTFS